ncbi:MAG: Holliday junction branch migration DNA helicase RuvB [Chloroflexota bacterium]|nr:Holliday junction branch migration DNA helicase RuvB [Chloroflexota bacterium]MDE2942213.1 Holliday junction branch migration DNA helicase RuvB [Chloroflexota bacterium]MDE3267681.1 Holliday junction branch migration DNA helicase RuvB [Chloroflexota bacterium]
MARERVIGENEQLPDPEETAESEEVLPLSLRPRSLREYVGQTQVVESLGIAIAAAKTRGEPLEHVLFHGPPGLGKTTLAHIVAREMGGDMVHTSGPALEKPLDIVGVLSNLGEGEVLFIDEIHRLPHTVEEYLYSAMEDFQVDFVTGKGAYARTLPFQLKRFTLIGATTRAGLLTPPLRDRFGMIYHLDFYSPEQLTEVVRRSSEILEVGIDRDGASEIASRSRGTPRVANRLLRRVRDYAQVKSGGHVDRDVADVALAREGVDENGLDRLDRLYLTTIAENYRGGPVGIDALAATVNEEVQTLVDVVEPFLLKEGFVLRTPGGRKIGEAAMTKLGLKEQGRLL